MLILRGGTFSKLVEQAEAEIARLKKPAAHRYELVRVEEKEEL